MSPARPKLPLWGLIAISTLGTAFLGLVFAVVIVVVKSPNMAALAAAAAAPAPAVAQPIVTPVAPAPTVTPVVVAATEAPAAAAPSHKTPAHKGKKAKARPTLVASAAPTRAPAGGSKKQHHGKDALDKLLGL